MTTAILRADPKSTLAVKLHHGETVTVEKITPHYIGMSEVDSIRILCADGTRLGVYRRDLEGKF